MIHVLNYIIVRYTSNRFHNSNHSLALRSLNPEREAGGRTSAPSVAALGLGACHTRNKSNLNARCFKLQIYEEMKEHRDAWRKINPNKDVKLLCTRKVLGAHRPVMFRVLSSDAPRPRQRREAHHQGQRSRDSDSHVHCSLKKAEQSFQDQMLLLGPFESLRAFAESLPVRDQATCCHLLLWRVRWSCLPQEVLISLENEVLDSLRRAIRKQQTFQICQ